LTESYRQDQDGQTEQCRQDSGIIKIQAEIRAGSNNRKQETVRVQARQISIERESNSPKSKNQRIRIRGINAQK